MNKATIIEKNGVKHYYDMNGTEVLEGDHIVWAESGKTEIVYRSIDGDLGIDATNPKWIESGRAVPCEYGIYPLTCTDLDEISVVGE